MIWTVFGRTNEQLNSWTVSVCASEKVFIIIYNIYIIYNNKPLTRIFSNKTVQLFVRSLTPFYSVLNTPLYTLHRTNSWTVSLFFKTDEKPVPIRKIDPLPSGIGWLFPWEGWLPRWILPAAGVHLGCLQLLTQGGHFLNRFLRTMRGGIWRCRE